MNWKYPAAVLWIGSSEVTSLCSVSWVLRLGCWALSVQYHSHHCWGTWVWPGKSWGQDWEVVHFVVVFCCSHFGGGEMGTAVTAVTAAAPERVLQHSPSPAGSTELALQQHHPSFWQTSFPSFVLSLLSLGLGLGVEKLCHKWLPEINWFCFPKQHTSPAQGQLSFWLWEATLGDVLHFCLFSG